MRVDGNVVPNSDSADDLGASGTAWNKLWVDDIDLNAQGSISIGGTGRIDLDADDDTSIRASADDIITFEAGAVDIAQMTTTMAVSGSSISTGSFGRVSTTTIDLASIQGNWTNAGNTVADLGTVTTVDINGGTIDGITSLTAGGDLDIGAHDLRAATITADSLTATRVPFAGTAGVLSDDADLTFATATLSATNLTTTGTIKNMALVSGSSVSTGSFGRVNVAGTLDAGAVTDELAAIIVAQIDDDEIPIAKLAEDSVTYVAGTGLGGGGVAALGNSATINAIGGNGITANANDLEITPAQTTIESIYKADLVIGEDAQTKIDFETANEIHFDVNNSELLNLTGNKISGSSTSTGSFGTIQIGGKQVYGDASGIGIGIPNPLDILHLSDGTAETRLQIENTGTGDPILMLQTDGLKNWYMGIDRSDSHKLHWHSTGGAWDPDNAQMALSLEGDLTLSGSFESQFGNISGSSMYQLVHLVESKLQH